MNDSNDPSDVTPPDDEFERMLQQMEEELSQDGEASDAGEDSADFSLASLSMDPDFETTIIDRGEDGSGFLFGQDDELSLSFAVQVAAGDGSFSETDAKGVLAGARSYKVTVLDDFSFGADAMRNSYEIILDPNSAMVSLQDVPAGTQWVLQCDDEGRLMLDKPAGVRVSVHGIARNPDGTQALVQLSAAGPEEARQVFLPVTDTGADHAEFMIGIGMAESEPPSHAFSVYLAIKLPR